MSIIKDGVNNKGQQHWKLYVPDKHCKAGLEVTISETDKGIDIGDGLIPYDEIKKIKKLKARITELQDALNEAADNLRIWGSVSQAKHYEDIAKEQP